MDDQTFKSLIFGFYIIFVVCTAKIPKCSFFVSPLYFFKWSILQIIGLFGSPYVFLFFTSLPPASAMAGRSACFTFLNSLECFGIAGGLTIAPGSSFVQANPSNFPKQPNTSTSVMFGSFIFKVRPVNLLIGFALCDYLYELVRCDVCSSSFFYADTRSSLRHWWLLHVRHYGMHSTSSRWRQRGHAVSRAVITLARY